MTNQLAIYGAGGFGREVLMLIQQINQVKQRWSFVGFYDDGLAAGTRINDYWVLGNRQTLNQQTEPLAVVIAVGNPAVKKQIVRAITNPLIEYPALIHPDVTLLDEQYIEVGSGSIVCAGAILTVNVWVGQHVLINLNCSVGHDAILENYCSLMPGVNVSGKVTLQEEVYVGTGATLINQLTVGTGTTIGAGAVVVQSLPAHCTAVGSPARPVKFHDPTA